MLKTCPISHANEASNEVVQDDPDIRNSLINDIEAAYHRFVAAAQTNDKDELRKLHIVARDHDFPNRKDTWSLYKKHSTFFIDGKKLDPRKITPKLYLVDDGNEWAERFRLARLTWSMPYNKGYGRRLRFVVFDEYHEAVIGILGFQSPPADLHCRDSLFDFPQDKKIEFINRTMDVFAIGAVPPYSNLLGGKLVAGLVSCDAIRQAYWKKYAAKKSQMSGRLIEQPLVAATTTSIFGRSSIYNRLRFNNRVLAEPIGYTKGFGTIHLEALYPRIIQYLEQFGDVARGGYGVGPKIRWQNITRTMQKLGLPRSFRNHGLCRQVFLFRFVDNLEEVLQGTGQGKPMTMSCDEYSDFWKQRWAIPRSIRDDSFRIHSSESMFTSLIGKSS